MEDDEKFPTAQPASGRPFWWLMSVVVLSGLAAKSASADELGVLMGRVVFKGNAPVASKVSLNKDIAICSKTHPVDEELLVDAKDGGLANVVVSLELAKGQKLPEVVLPAGRKLAAEVVMTNKNCRFEPHIAVMTTKQTLVLGNDDPVAHNTLANLFYNTPFNESIGTGAFVKKKLTKVERRPAQVSCPIHAWMKGWVVVKDHSYVAVSDSHGRFRIRDLPPGEWTFQFWQEKAGYLSKMELKSGIVEDKKGIYRLKIKPGENNLGDIAVNASLFE
ncbi:MAG: carboxypeptidase regulatory-like domain-containing protein [Planctomycetales bacterium]